LTPDGFRPPTIRTDNQAKVPEARIHNEPGPPWCKLQVVMQMRLFVSPDPPSTRREDGDAVVDQVVASPLVNPSKR